MGHDAIAFQSGWDEYGIAHCKPPMFEGSILDVDLLNVNSTFAAIDDYGSHSDDKFNPDALLILQKITLHNIIGTKITIAGNFKGIEDSAFSFTSIKYLFINPFNLVDNMVMFICFRVF